MDLLLRACNDLDEAYDNFIITDETIEGLRFKFAVEYVIRCAYAMEGNRIMDEPEES